MDELTLYDNQGKPKAYITTDDGTIYCFSGEPVAYVQDGHIYGFNGKHLGWFEDGVVWDHQGARAGFRQETLPVSAEFLPFKAFKQFRPFKAFKELPPMQPWKSLNPSGVPLETLLCGG